MTNKDYNEPTPTWSFSYRDIEGATSTKSFNAVTWSEALQEFVNFLRGIGYVLADDAIQIRNDHECLHWFGNYCSPVEEDWAHPDDFNHNPPTGFMYPPCPPFESNPNDCAFKDECNDCSCMDCDFEPEPVACSLEDFIRALSKLKGE